jgi:hypothetical protein
MLKLLRISVLGPYGAPRNIPAKYDFHMHRTCIRLLKVYLLLVVCLYKILYNIDNSATKV